MIHYENSREFFNRIAKMYHEYLELYRFFNHGSSNGCTSFADFYWLHAYLYRNSSLANKFNRAG